MSTSKSIRLGTRRSKLAVTQSEWVAERLRANGYAVELVEIVTEGDTNRASLATMGGTGVFAAAIRHALLRGEIDMAVHSLKDLPVAPFPGLTVAGIPKREDPRDALVARDGLTLGELPSGAKIGTGSPRRAAQLAALGLGLEIHDIRGNIDTRMAFVTDGELDGVILARSGLNRVNQADVVTESIDPLQMLPAPGQGALGLECRSDDEYVIQALAGVDDAETRAAVTAERAVLGELEAGCAAPVGALAEIVEDVDGSLEISLRAFVGSADGSFELRRSETGPIEEAEKIGVRLAQTLLAEGAGEVIPKRDASDVAKDPLNAKETE